MAKFPRLKSASGLAPDSTKFPKMLSPTAIAVIFSVAAHGVLFAFGPRTGFSFAALTEAAQLASAEETIVPVVELSDADRSRLPAFAQSRGLPPNTTGLSSLAIPPGLPPIGSNTPRRSQSGSLPNPTANRGSISSSLSRARTPRTGRTSNVGRVPQNRTPVTSTVVIPSTPTVPAVPRSEPVITASGEVVTLNPDGTTTLPSGDTTAVVQTPQSGESSTSLRETLEAFEQANNPDVGPIPPEGGVTATPTPGTEEPSQDIAVTPSDPIDTADAQGNISRLVEGFRYDDTDVSPEAGQANLEAWLEASAAGKNDVTTDAASITIDSNFKGCVEARPNEGSIGVLVNPDGTQESIQVLRSIGYDLLNRQAIDAVTYTDFGQPDVPTQYEVTVEVLYDAEGCIDTIPETTDAAEG